MPAEVSKYFLSLSVPANGNGEDGKQYQQGVAVHLLAQPFPLGEGHCPDSRCAEEHQHKVGGDVDEVGVDGEEVKCSQQHPEISVGDGIAAGAQGRHQRRGDGNAGDDVVGLVLSGLSDNAGNAAGEGNQHIKEVRVGAGEKLFRGFLDRGQQKVDGGGRHTHENLHRKAHGVPLYQIGIVGGSAVGDRQNAPHQRGDQHGADDDCHGVGVESHRGDQNRTDHNHHIGAGDLSAAQDAIPNFLVGGGILGDGKHFFQDGRQRFTLPLQFFSMLHEITPFDCVEKALDFLGAVWYNKLVVILPPWRNRQTQRT